MDLWRTLLENDVQRFIRENERVDSRVIALQQNTGLNVPVKMLAIQVAGRQKAQKKLPIYYHQEKIVYPPSINIEQSSSQATALFKAGILSSLSSNKRTVVDLTGGFGIDTFFLSTVAASIVHVEPDALLQAIAHHNHDQLGADNIHYVNTTAENFLSSNQQKVDLFYIDPSRRKNSQKFSALSDCEPDIVALQQLLFSQGSFLLLKAAPLLDISSALQSLQGVKKVFIVSVDNECKELLFFCEKNFTDEAEIVAVNLLHDGETLSSYSFRFSEERLTLAAFSDVQTYLYEPNASILKAGAFKSIATSFSVFKLAPSTHLYTSYELVPNFPGRIFRIEKIVKPDAGSVHELLVDKKANVLTRNYPLKPEELKKKLKLQDGGEQYVIGFSGVKNKFVAHCTRIL